MSSASCVYEGVVRHRRHEPVRHEFAYPIAMLYADLAERDASAVRELVAERTDTRPGGPVRRLSRPRGFNPVTFSFCFDAAGERVEAVVAHVTNTPWGERHDYVVEGTEAELDKAFHVSPFLGMDHRYAIRVTEPGERLSVHIAAGATFDATLTLRRRRLDRLPWQVPTRLRIYAQALRLKLKGAPYFPHPGRS